MSASTPASPRPDDRPASKGPDEPLRTEEVASVSGGIMVGTHLRCDIHADQVKGHTLPDGTICLG